MNSIIVTVLVIYRSKPLVMCLVHESIILDFIPAEFRNVKPRVVEGQPNLMQPGTEQFEHREREHDAIGRHGDRCRHQRQQNFQRDIGREMGAFSAVFGQGPHAGILQECSDDTPVWGLVGCIDSGRYGFKMFSINKLAHYLGSHVLPHTLLTAAFPTQANL